MKQWAKDFIVCEDNRKQNRPRNGNENKQKYGMVTHVLNQASTRLKCAQENNLWRKLSNPT